MHYTLCIESCFEIMWRSSKSRDCVSYTLTVLRSGSIGTAFLICIPLLDFLQSFVRTTPCSGTSSESSVAILFRLLCHVDIEIIHDAISLSSFYCYETWARTSLVFHYNLKLLLAQDWYLFHWLIISSRHHNLSLTLNGVHRRWCKS